MLSIILDNSKETGTDHSCRERFRCFRVMSGIVVIGDRDLPKRTLLTWSQSSSSSRQAGVPVEPCEAAVQNGLGPLHIAPSSIGKGIARATKERCGFVIGPTSTSIPCTPSVHTSSFASATHPVKFVST